MAGVLTPSDTQRIHCDQSIPSYFVQFDREKYITSSECNLASVFGVH